MVTPSKVDEEAALNSKHITVGEGREREEDKKKKRREREREREREKKRREEREREREEKEERREREEAPEGADALSETRFERNDGRNARNVFFL